jgi:guanine deaminase
MQAVGKLAQQHQAVVQTHLAETVPECQLVESMFPGQSYTAVYDSMGLLTPRTLLGHGIYLSPEERRLLVERGSVVAHCPTANVFLQSGIMPRSTWQAEGVRLSLGTDIGAGYDVAMPRVARAMIDAAKYLRMSVPAISVPTAAEAWYQITTGNADAVGWPQVGRLAAGAEADVLVLQPNIAWQTATDPLAMLLYAWDSRWIKQVLIAGQPTPM